MSKLSFEPANPSLLFEQYQHLPDGSGFDYGTGAMGSDVVAQTERMFQNIATVLAAPSRPRRGVAHFDDEPFQVRCHGIGTAPTDLLESSRRVERYDFTRLTLGCRLKRSAQQSG